MNSYTSLATSRRFAMSNIMVSHSNALVSAGLIAMIQRISGCAVHDGESVEVDGSLKLPLQNIDLLVADSTALVRSAVLRQFADPSHTLTKPQIVLLTAAAGIGEVATPVPPGVSACLSMHCHPDDLLNTVCGLIGTSMPSPDGPRVVPNTEVSASVPTLPRPRGGLAPSALRRVREHIEANLAEHIELCDLAALTGLSACHFSRAFKQSVGMPPHRYLMSRRIAAATRLIETTDRPMCDIALEVGFSDQSHFTRVFTVEIGESPRRFRHLRR
ncbi:MAG: AraC family transcriptional regulator [Caldimonas sp.]